MHIVLGIIGLIVGAAFWWYRLKTVRDAASEAVDAIGRARGKIRRTRIRNKSELSPITTISDPVTAAATLIASLAIEDAIMTPSIEQRVRGEVGKIADPAKLDETIIYANWAAAQVVDTSNVIDGCCAILTGALNDDEKRELIAMVEYAIPASDRHANFSRNMDRLYRKLGVLRD